MYLRSFLAMTLLFSTAFAQQKTLEQRRAANEIAMAGIDEPPSMDPTKQADQVSGMFLGHMFEGLMTTDKNGNVVAGSAEKMEVSPDGKTYTFTIRKNAKWHDGKPVTAHDFEYAFRRLVNPSFASEYSQMGATAHIVNAKEIVNKKMGIDKLGAKALSDSTFEVKLHAPLAFFPSLMTFQVFFPIRKDLVEKYGDKFATTVESLVGNGPFKVVSWKKESSFRMEKAPNYWNSKEIKLSAIDIPVILKDGGAIYNLFRTGSTDITWGLDAERVKLANQDRRKTYTFNDGGVFYMEMNMRKGKKFENRKLREAIKVGFNRSEYVNKIIAVPGNKPSFGLVPDYMPGSKAGLTYRKEAPLTWKDGDVAKARALVKEYLTETKQTKVPPFTILGSDGTQAKKEAEYIQQSLSRLLGTEVRAELVPFKTRLQKMRDHDFDMVLAGWGPDYRDPMTFMDLFLSGNDNNRAGYNNPKFDELIGKAGVAIDLAERVKLFAEAEKILSDDAPIVPMFQRGRAYVMQDGLTGVIRTQIGADPDFRFASWRSTTAKSK